VELADSGRRHTNEAGFTREPDDDKQDLTWIFDIEGLDLVPRELIERLAAHYTNGARKYSPDNWRLGTDPTSLARYRRSAARHVFAWWRGEQDEDHAAAIAWNVFTYEINKSVATGEWVRSEE
jgi:hypothetical protein